MGLEWRWVNINFKELPIFTPKQLASTLFAPVVIDFMKSINPFSRPQAKSPNLML